MAQYSQRTQPMHSKCEKKLNCAERESSFERERRLARVREYSREMLARETSAERLQRLTEKRLYYADLRARIRYRKRCQHQQQVLDSLATRTKRPDTRKPRADKQSTQNAVVESSAGASVHYVPTLWYYKHLNFLSGKKDTDSDDSDSDHNADTVYVRLPRGQKRPTTSISTDQEGEPERDQEGDPASSVDASAAAFGRSVGAQLHHLSKMQRCIAEKLISDVIYHAKMEQLSLDASVNLKEAVEDQAATLIPKAGPSWYDTDIDNGAQESSFSCQLLTETTEDLVRREMEETASAVNFIKMESDNTESYVFNDDDDELSHAVDIVKEELV